VQRILQSRGYAVEVAADGDTALRIAQTATFDAVVTDVAMPGMSGPQLVARLRETRADLPAIFISGYTERPGTLPEDAVFLGKPFRAPDLLDHVAEVLDR
jgi:CheY-like chemotaxis protein